MKYNLGAEFNFESTKYVLDKPETHLVAALPGAPKVVSSFPALDKHCVYVKLDFVTIMFLCKKIYLSTNIFV